MNLPELHARIWQELARACTARGHAWRTPVLATRDGEGADARTLVLREVEAEAQCLRLYTDARSPKVAQISAHPQGTLLAWCPTLQWQLRLRVTLRVETDGLAVSSRWAQLRVRPQAQDYLSPLPPGSPLLEGAPAAERGHFSLIEAKVLRLDWLGLSPQSHRRAVFDGAGACWLTP